MPLTMRPTGLSSGIDKDRQDYTVYTGGWDIGRIYEVRGGPDDLRWFWSFALHGPMTRLDRPCVLWKSMTGRGPTATSPRALS